MPTVDQYIHAATRDSTRKAYQAAIRHFEEDFGGFLPATPIKIAEYLAAYAESLSLNTLKQRLTALSVWHTTQGFPDPTNDPQIAKIVRGIRELHPQEEKQAKPLQIDHLAAIVTHLTNAITSSSNPHEKLRALRDKSLFLLGFWRGARPDEICRIQVESLDIRPGESISYYLPRTKTDKGQGRRYHAPAVPGALCPVAATLDWISAADISSGPLYRRLDRWGNLAEDGLNKKSLGPLIRDVMEKSGIEKADEYTAYTLRRGFATYAGGRGVGVLELQRYVGWKSPSSAARYVDLIAIPRQILPDASEAQFQHEGSKKPDPALLQPKGMNIDEKPIISTKHSVSVRLAIYIENGSKFTRGKKKACESINYLIESTYRGAVLDETEYRIAFAYENEVDLKEQIDDIFDEIYSISNDRNCEVHEISVQNEATGQYWNECDGGWNAE